MQNVRDRFSAAYRPTFTDRARTEQKGFGIIVRIIEVMLSDTGQPFSAAKLNPHTVMDTMSRLSSACPDISFLFPGQRVIYSHANVLRDASAYFKAMFDSEFSECRKRTLQEASSEGSFTDVSLSARPEHCDDEDDTEPPPDDGKSVNPLDSIPMTTVEILDFSYVMYALMVCQEVFG